MKLTTVPKELKKKKDKFLLIIRKRYCSLQNKPEENITLMIVVVVDAKVKNWIWHFFYFFFFFFFDSWTESDTIIIEESL